LAPCFALSLTRAPRMLHTAFLDRTLVHDFQSDVLIAA
jgi:hypothetical protein